MPLTEPSMRIATAAKNATIMLAALLVGTTKVYSGVGADIVMESLTLIDRLDSLDSLQFGGRRRPD